MGRERVVTALLVGSVLLEASAREIDNIVPTEDNLVTAGQVELEFATLTPSSSINLQDRNGLENISNIIATRTPQVRAQLLTEEPSLEELHYFIQQTPTPNILSAIIENGSFRGRLNLSPSFVPEEMTDLNDSSYIVLWGGRTEYLIQESALPYVQNFAQDLYSSTGDKLMIVSAYRSYYEQIELNSGYPDQAALPGSSQHQTGYAIDILLVKPDNTVSGFSDRDKETLRIAERNGIVHPVAWDSPHFFIADALYRGASQDLLEVGQDNMFSALNDLLMYMYGDK